MKRRSRIMKPDVCRVDVSGSFHEMECLILTDLNGTGNEI